jgi:hypothetical protein
LVPVESASAIVPQLRLRGKDRGCALHVIAYPESHGEGTPNEELRDQRVRTTHAIESLHGCIPERTQDRYSRQRKSKSISNSKKKKDTRQSNVNLAITYDTTNHNTFIARRGMHASKHERQVNGTPLRQTRDGKRIKSFYPSTEGVQDAAADAQPLASLAIQPDHQSIKLTYIAVEQTNEQKCHAR